MPAPLPPTLAPLLLVTYSGAIPGYVTTGTIVSNDGSQVVIAWADDSLDGNYFGLSILDASSDLIPELLPTS